MQDSDMLHHYDDTVADCFEHLDAETQKCLQDLQDSILYVCETLNLDVFDFYPNLSGE